MRHLRGVILGVLLFVLVPVMSVGASGLPFSVDPVLPDNQVDGVGSYLSIDARDGGVAETYTFILTNHSDEEQIIEAVVVDAYTSPNGGIQYTDDNTMEHSQITNERYYLSNYASLKSNTVTLEPNGVQEMVLTLDPDVSTLDGVLLGGVRFSVKEADDAVDESAGFQINNRINMVMGVMLTFDTETPIGFDVGEPTIEPMPSYFVMRFPVEHTSPRLASDVRLIYDVISPHDENDILFSGEQTVQFAPMTTTNLSLPFNYHEIETDLDYVIRGELVYTDGENDTSASFEEVFQYGSDEDAASGVESDPLQTPTVLSETPNEVPWWVYLVGLVIVQIVLFGAYRGIQAIRNR